MIFFISNNIELQRKFIGNLINTFYKIFIKFLTYVYTKNVIHNI